MIEKKEATLAGCFFFDIYQRKRFSNCSDLGVQLFTHLNLYKMTIRTTKSLCILMLILMLIACERVEVNAPIGHFLKPTVVLPSSVSIKEAKGWFEKEYLESQRSEVTEESKNIVKRIFWKDAFMGKMSNGQDLLIVPIEHHETSLPANADTYLWIFRDDTNHFSAKVVEYLTSLKDYGGEINIANFSGAMTVRDWNGKLLNGFTFKNGTPAGLLLSVRGVETERIKELRSGKLNVTICNTVKFTLSSCTNFAYKICLNGNCSELRPNDTPSYCDLYEITVPQCYWVADFPSQTNPYSGSNIDVTVADASKLTMPGFNLPGIDIAKFVKCFGVIDANSKYKIIFYDIEPLSGSGKVIKGSDVGHTFIGFEKTTNGVVTNQTVGFYPNSYSSNWVTSHMADNGGSAYTVSATHDNVGAGAFKKALDEVVKQKERLYHYAGYNCTGAAASVATAAGLTFPKNETFFPFSVAKGLSPGQLGLDFRNNQSSGTINPNGGVAPQSKGSCN